jgi:Zn-finger nucleic acid-binding protein
MEVNESAIIQLELKYCERCGGLFLRRLEMGEVYCEKCAVQMEELQPPKKWRSRPRLPVNLEGCALFVVARAADTEGGQA